MDDRDLEDGEVAEGQLLVPSRDPAAFLEPRDAALNGVPETVGGRIKDAASSAPALLIGSLRDHRLDLSTVKPVPDVAVAVAFVPSQAAGTATSAARARRNADRLHERLETSGLVTLPGADLDREWETMTIRHEMDLGPKTPSRAS